MQPNHIIDLRSDTVTLPTEEMLEAASHAKMGDDYYGEDPTVNKLQEMAAQRMGKEAALLVPSGTQANLISLMSNCCRGELVILESESHIYWYEVGGISSVAGLFPWPVKTELGAYASEDLKAAIKPKSLSYPEPSVICVENTHNRHGGTVLTSHQLNEFSDIAKQNNLKLYMDGARIFNAAIALQTTPDKLTKYVDNLMFCLSKGLCCPIGSIIVGNHEFITKARKIRKLLGGQLRQAGIIAAPGIVALEKMVDRLKDDHENAKLLAQKISKTKGISIDLDSVQTNMVTFTLDSRVDDRVFLAKIKELGVLALAMSKNKIRLVTHYGIERSDVEKASAAIEIALAGFRL